MARCPVHRAPAAPPLVQNGEVNFQARHVGYIVAGLFTLASIITSTWLVQKHLKWYSCKPQQRHIVRLLFMVPIYAIITLASYLSLSNATSLLLIRDAYESVVLASFFSLLLEYLAGPAHPPPEHPPKSKKRRKNARDEEQERLDTESTFPTGTESIAHPLTKAERATIVYKVFYRVPMYPPNHPLRTDPQNTHKPLRWIFPLGSVRARPKDGLSYLHWMKWGVLQYCVVRPGSTLAAVILQQMGLYCESSWSWRWGHVYVVTIVSVSVTVAMYCLIQLYTTISKELKPYSPLLKLFAVKAVVFLTFWQSALLSGLASLDIIKDTEYMTAEDIVVGFSALLQTFEMMCFALLHVKAFSYVPYKRIARIRTETRSSPTPERNRARDPDMPPLLTPPNEERVGSRPDRPVPAPPKQQLINLFQAFTFTDTFRDFRAGVLYFFGRGASREADDVCRREERFREVFGRERVQRSFMKVSGYKGLPQDEGRAIPGVQYSPLPTPPKEDYDDAPQLSLSKTRESEDTVRDGQLEYLVQRLDYGYSPRAPDPPPRGAYVPKHGPGPSIAWSGDGVITPPLTPGVVSPGRSRSPRAAGVGSPLQIPGVSFPPYAPGGSSPIYSPGGTSQRQTPGVGTSSYASPAPVSPVKAPSRRIGDVYVGGTRGVEFVSQPRPMGVYASPRPEGTTTPRLGESPTSPLSAGPRLPPRLEGAYISPRPEAVHAPRSGGARAQRDRSQSLPLPRTTGTHISPDSAQMLAQASPLFQQSFTTEARANYPLSPVSPPAQRGRGDLAPPRASGETRRTSGCGGPSQRSSAYEACSPRTSGYVDASQRYSGFTIPQWASVTPTHSQWPTDTTAPTRRTSGVTTDPPSPTRGRRMSITEEEEPPSREDSMLARMFSGATRTTESRARDSESAGARTSMTSFRIGDNVSSTTGSDVGVNDSVSVQPVRTVSFCTGAPTLVRLDTRRDSISSPSLVSSSVADRRDSPSSPSSTSSLRSPTFASRSHLPSPPEVARPLRRMSASLQLRVPQGPRVQPRAIVLPAPLSPARYPHSQWRSTVVRTSSQARVSSVHGSVGHWSPLQPPSASSSESGLVGRGAGRSSAGAVALPSPEYTSMSSLSSLSNIEDRYPTTSRRSS
ncbi:Transmembrane protein 184 homolog DDB_G0284525 OS=Dictyostelium discoideum GN=tmem184A PE=3 SV=1 [Rhizoctonia solani AG-1 IB]|uniref:Transmembrane protein 184 homolog DDB_G0284525 n=1 Tax=Thanatephorus cucumeris (strain AG1-IB / isolate 7/3/14) TaxID=1108050 RepID=A0A0B7F8E9_THACB|nr:Transmembrane protein 184 homolog DDB_G0284525 OS=Dictyostelium discoideum GN=tmem184A PE=3 SV=1 [Rhizoctonia solani AG-1 IB]